MVDLVLLAEFNFNSKQMQETFRWIGTTDQIKLSYIKQAGASRIVTTLLAHLYVCHG